jgi:hypothetical protein
MNKQAKAVLWIGLFLVTVQVVAGWGVLKQVLFKGEPSNQSGSNSGSSGGWPSWLNPFENPISGINPVISSLLVHETPSHARVR